MQASTIDEVISSLDEIIHTCSINGLRAGYFASLYRKMTVAVKEGVLRGIFDDGSRMEKLDVTFANRYFAAYTAWNAHQPVTLSWQLAFDADDTDKYAVIQHLLLGMNAHINLDLGIATASICDGNDINTMVHDFDKINEIIGSQVNMVQNDLAKIWFPMRFLNEVDNKDEDSVINFCIVIARKVAWNNAVMLAGMSSSKWETQIDKTDQSIATIAERITSPGFLPGLLLRWIKFSESAAVATNISYLNAG